MDSSFTVSAVCIFFDCMWLRSSRDMSASAGMMLWRHSLTGMSNTVLMVTPQTKEGGLSAM